MLNQYPAWKHVLLVVVLLTGTFFVLPNLFGSDPAVQISAERGAVVDDALAASAMQALRQKSIEPVHPPAIDNGRLLIRFGNEEIQLQAKDVLRQALGRQFIVALNLAPATPGWLASMGALPMYLGLDLRGGVHFLMEVDMDAAVAQAEERYVGDIRASLREQRIRWKSLTRSAEQGIHVRFRKPEVRGRAEDLIRGQFPDLDVTEEDASEEWNLRLHLSARAARQTRQFALQQNITTLRNRVNELGVAEPVIQQQGENRIVVQLPGVQDTAKAKDILGATATLEFRLVNESGDVEAAVQGRVPHDAKLYQTRAGRPVLLNKRVMLTGDYITDAASGLDQQSGSPAVHITLDGRGGRIFSDRTKDKIGRPMAVVFIENKTESHFEGGKETKRKRLVEEVINIATIRDQLGRRFQITGLDSTEEARDLALLLRAGALAAPIDIIEERTVGPSLGQQNIDQGFLSVAIAFALVLVFMGWYYRLFGLVADMALFFNLVLVVGILSMFNSSGFPATLTLPGIAGIVLTVGMAVDANVLIFERIREELRNGNTPQSSIHAGYEKALSTIADSNITTLIAAVVLFGFGTGPIKGFAITLSIGIVCSMFTAIMGTRAVVNLIYGGKRVQALAI